jgi:anti-anti-sigma factor
MAPLTIEVSEGSPCVIRLRGELDMATADQLAVAMKDTMLGEPALTIDMADVTFVDAAGLRVILQFAESRDGAGPLELVNAPLAARLLHLVGLAEIPSLHLCDGEGLRNG